MSPQRGRQPLPDDLRELIDALIEQRPALGPLELDRVKLRAMSAASRSASTRDTRVFVRSRLATVLVAGFLLLGTGGTLALAGGGNSGHNEGNAGSAQYSACEEGKPERPGNGYGDKNHCHTGPPGQEK